MMAPALAPMAAPTMAPVAVRSPWLPMTAPVPAPTTPPIAAPFLAPLLQPTTNAAAASTNSAFRTLMLPDPGMDEPPRKTVEDFRAHDGRRFGHPIPSAAARAQCGQRHACHERDPAQHRWDPHALFLLDVDLDGTEIDGFLLACIRDATPDEPDEAQHDEQYPDDASRTHVESPPGSIHLQTRHGVVHTPSHGALVQRPMQ